MFVLTHNLVIISTLIVYTFGMHVTQCCVNDGVTVK